MGRVQRFRIRYVPQSRPMSQWLSRNSFQTSEIRKTSNQEKTSNIFHADRYASPRLVYDPSNAWRAALVAFRVGLGWPSQDPLSFQSRLSWQKAKSTPEWSNKDAAVSLAYQRGGDNWLGWTRHEHLYLTWGFWDRGEPSGWVQRVEGVNGTKNVKPSSQGWMGKGTPYCKFGGYSMYILLACTGNNLAFFPKTEGE